MKSQTIKGLAPGEINKNKNKKKKITTTMKFGLALIAALASAVKVQDIEDAIGDADSIVLTEDGYWYPEYSDDWYYDDDYYYEDDYNYDGDWYDDECWTDDWIWEECSWSSWRHACDWEDTPTDCGWWYLNDWDYSEYWVTCDEWQYDWWWCHEDESYDQCD